MRVFKNKWFHRFARKESIADIELCQAIRRAEQGMIDADLGGHPVKQRIGCQGQGRAGGYRAIIAIRLDNSAFFMFGLAKSDRENLEVDEERAYKEAAKELLKLSGVQLDALVGDGSLVEIDCNAQSR